MWPRVSSRLLLAGYADPLRELSARKLLDVVEDVVTEGMPPDRYVAWRSRVYAPPAGKGGTGGGGGPRRKMTKAQYLAKAAAEMNRR